MPLAQFAATVTEVLENVRRTRRPVLVTRSGEPIAEVVPAPSGRKPTGWLGSFRDRGQIVGDIVSPAVDESEWDVLRP